MPLLRLRQLALPSNLTSPTLIAYLPTVFYDLSDFAVSSGFAAGAALTGTSVPGITGVLCGVAVRFNCATAAGLINFTSG